MLADHGRGRGCDICKPAIGSIMASLWNEHVLDLKHVGLQDTNDTFMANMQKDGTYWWCREWPVKSRRTSLIVLGEVAKNTTCIPKSPVASGWICLAPA